MYNTFHISNSNVIYSAFNFKNLILGYLKSTNTIIMKTRNGLLLLFGLLFTNILYACSFTSGSFCECAGLLDDHLIISGTIISVDEDGIDLEVIDVLRGEESNAVIRIWDGTDFYCNGPWSMAASDIGQVGDVKILTLPKIVETENSWDVVGDYRRPNWYEYLTDLRVIDGQVEGLIRGYVGWDQNNELVYSQDYIGQLSYETFATSYTELLDCSTMVDVENITTKFQTTIENPFTSNLNITLDENFEGTISIFDLNGVAISEKLIRFQNNVEIDLSFVPNGLYFVRFENEDGLVQVEKVVKQ